MKCQAKNEPELLCDSDNAWPEYDAQGIYLCRVCDECRDRKLARFRPEILTGYDQSDVDEPIEPDDWGRDDHDWENRDALMGATDYGHDGGDW